MQLFVPHKNPPAAIGNIQMAIMLELTKHTFLQIIPLAITESPIKHYKHHSLVRAYQGDTFFWGLAPQPGDQMIFTFEVSYRVIIVL